MDALGVALAGTERHYRAGYHPVHAPVLPVRFNQSRLHQLVDIAFHRQQRHIGFKSAGNGPGLGSRCLIRLLERERLPRFGLPLCREQRQDFTHGILRHTIGSYHQRKIPLLWLHSCSFFSIPAPGHRQREHCQH
ncbi:hypothetical protein D3C75_1141490 [compost metagenome]